LSRVSEEDKVSSSVIAGDIPVEVDRSVGNRASRVGVVWDEDASGGNQERGVEGVQGERAVVSGCSSSAVQDVEVDSSVPVDVVGIDGDEEVSHSWGVAEHIVDVESSNGGVRVFVASVVSVIRSSGIISSVDVEVS